MEVLGNEEGPSLLLNSYYSCQRDFVQLSLSYSLGDGLCNRRWEDSQFMTFFLLRSGSTLWKYLLNADIYHTRAETSPLCECQSYQKYTADVLQVSYFSSNSLGLTPKKSVGFGSGSKNLVDTRLNTMVACHKLCKYAMWVS